MEKISRKSAKGTAKVTGNIAFSTKEKSYIESLSKELSKQLFTKKLEEDFGDTKEILKMVGAGLFLAGSIVMPGLPKALKPLIKPENQDNPWKRYNFKYLKQTLNRLEKQKLVRFNFDGDQTTIELTDQGRRKILRYSLDNIAVKAPGSWSGVWTLVSYDIPNAFKAERDSFRQYLESWGFYPLHESMYLHAYPCEKEVEFTRQYLGIAKYVRIFKVSRIENDQPFRDFFGV